MMSFTRNSWIQRFAACALLLSLLIAGMASAGHSHEHAEDPDHKPHQCLLCLFAITEDDVLFDDFFSAEFVYFQSIQSRPKLNTRATLLVLNETARAPPIF